MNRRESNTICYKNKISRFCQQTKLFVTMKQEVLIIFLFSCAFAAAMVPRERRAVNTEEEHRGGSTKPASASTSGESGEDHICLPHTPCAWSMYNPLSKIVEDTVTNNYCKCAKGLSCVENEDDKSATSYVHRCRKPEDALHISR